MGGVLDISLYAYIDIRDINIYIYLRCKTKAHTSISDVETRTSLLFNEDTNSNLHSNLSIHTDYKSFFSIPIPLESTFVISSIMSATHNPPSYASSDASSSITSTTSTFKKPLLSKLLHRKYTRKSSPSSHCARSPTLCDVERNI